MRLLILLALLLSAYTAVADTEPEVPVTIVSQEHRLNVVAESAKGYEVQHYDIKGRRIRSDPIAGTRIEDTVRNPDPKFGATRRHSEQGDDPVARDDEFSAALSAEVPGGAKAFAKLSTFAGEAGDTFRIDGSIDVSATTDTEPDWGAKASASAEYSIQVRVLGPSVIYVNYCDEIEIGLVAENDIVRYADICRIQTRSSPPSAQNDLLRRLLPAQDASGKDFDPDVLSGQMIHFAMGTDSFQSSESTRPASGRYMGVSIRPGCPIALTEPAQSPLSDMFISVASEKLPEAMLFDETDEGRSIRADEIELGRSEYFDDDAKLQAERAAGNLANPVKAYLSVSIAGPNRPTGVHTLVIKSAAGGGQRFTFDFDASDSFDDIDAFFDRVIVALRARLGSC